MTTAMELRQDTGREAYTVRETSRLIGLSMSRIYELIGDDKIPFVKVGERRYLVPRRRLLAWLNGGEIPEMPGPGVESALKH